MYLSKSRLYAEKVQDVSIGLVGVFHVTQLAEAWHLRGPMSTCGASDAGLPNAVALDLALHLAHLVQRLVAPLVHAHFHIRFQTLASQDDII